MQELQDLGLDGYVQSGSRLIGDDQVVRLGLQAERPPEALDGTDQLVNNWIGYSGMIGVRFYLSSRLGLDFKFGFMNNSCITLP